MTMTEENVIDHAALDFQSFSIQHTMTQGLANDGEPARIVTLKNQQGMQLVLMDIGATWLSCQLPMVCDAKQSELREVLLGVSTMADFQRHTSYMGVTVGRYANRIESGQFEIDGQSYQVSTNQGQHCLHGGTQGFNQRRWQIKAQTEQSVTFTLYSPDGDQGFPGDLSLEVTYILTNDHAVQIEYQAKTTKATPINLTNHAYFNLMGAESGLNCLDHLLWIDSANYLPTNAEGIPEDHLQPVQQTSFDFQTEKTLAQDLLKDQQQQNAKGYDHSYWFSPERDFNRAVACLTSADRRVSLSVYTDKPAMQLYSGNWLAGTPNRQNSTYQDYAGVALETQFLPNSPNHPEWEHNDCILYPEQTYRYFTRYAFSVN